MNLRHHIMTFVGSLSTTGLVIDSDNLGQSVSVIAKLAPENRTSDQNNLLNRDLLNAAFPGILYTEDIHRPYYWFQRAAYCFGYPLHPLHCLPAPAALASNAERLSDNS
ncbi:MAG: hypothetical protein KDB03_28030, partial [Planctomycetales bacterium]|nr:hypothetical protein [Planctomycetales bacterium]